MDQGLIPLDNAAEGILAAVQAFSHQVGIVLFRCEYGFHNHHVTLHVPEKGVWVTGNLH
jgi:hypothetical protein